MQVEWWWLIVAFFFGLGFGREEGHAKKKKKENPYNDED
jgi:hypothetical protein